MNSWECAVLSCKRIDFSLYESALLWLGEYNFVHWRLFPWLELYHLSCLVGSDHSAAEGLSCNTRATLPQGHLTARCPTAVLYHNWAGERLSCCLTAVLFYSQTVSQLSGSTAVLYHSWAVCAEWNLLLHHTSIWGLLLALNRYQWPSIDKAW